MRQEHVYVFYDLLRVKSKFLLALVILCFYTYPTVPTLTELFTNKPQSRTHMGRDWKHIPGCDATGNFSFIKDKGGWSTWSLPGFRLN